MQTLNSAAAILKDTYMTGKDMLRQHMKTHGKKKMGMPMPPEFGLSKKNRGDTMLKARLKLKARRK